MKKILAIALTLGFCLVLALVAGCSQQAAPSATPAPTVSATNEATAAPTSAPTVSSDSVTPGPTQTLPEVWSIEMQVQNNGYAPKPQINIVLNGGKGMNVMPEIDIKLTRSDGVVETASMVQPLTKGKEIDLDSTTQNNDRVEIWVITPNMDKLKIYDQIVPWRAY